MSAEEEATAIITALREQIKQVQEQWQPHVHRWDILGIWTPPGRPVHPRDTSTAYTVVLIKCRECDLPDTTSLDGTWTEEQIRKASDGEQ